jgi:hypothetical protein
MHAAEGPHAPGDGQLGGVPARPAKRDRGARAGDDNRGPVRARSHCRFALPLIHFIPYSLTYLVPLILKRRRNISELFLKPQVRSVGTGVVAKFANIRWGEVGDLVGGQEVGRVCSFLWESLESVRS